MRGVLLNKILKGHSSSVLFYMLSLSHNIFRVWDKKTLLMMVPANITIQAGLHSNDEVVGVAEGKNISWLGVRRALAALVHP